MDKGGRGRVHVRCGSDIRGAVVAAGLGGRYIVIADAVCQGPVPKDATAEEFRAARARFVAENYDGYDLARAERRMRRELQALEGLDRYDEIVLWYEHDLYDQAALIRLLAELADRPEVIGRMTLVSIGSHPAVKRFVGFANLTPEQLGTLFPGRKSVTAEHVCHAEIVWDAYRGDDPVTLRKAGDAAGGVLPFLPAALDRHLHDLPSTRNGLGLTERLFLQAIADGATTPGQAFGRLDGELDPQPFLGDLMAWPIIRALADAIEPALTPWRGPCEPIALTDFGRALLAGNADWAATNGLDRWVGGIRLEGRSPPWRWSEDAACPVPGA